MQLMASGTFCDALKQAQAAKATVTLHFRNGTTLAGLVGGVEDHNAILTQLSGKEYYDALVRIEDISAISVRVRGA